MTRRRRIVATLAIAAWSVIAPVASAAPFTHPAPSASIPDDPATPADSTRWYRCLLGSLSCGRMIETTSATDAGGEISRTDLLLRFVRESTTTTVTIRSEIEVDATGAAVRMTLEQMLGDEPVVSEWIFGPDDVLERRRQGVRTIETRVPRPSGDWHLPGAAMEIARRTATAAAPTTLRVIDPSRGLDPVAVTYRRAGSESIVVDGAVLAGERWEIEDPDGTVTTEVVDAEGRTLASRVSMGAGLGDLEIVLADRESAEAAATGRVELLEAGLVRPTFVARPTRLDIGGHRRYRLRLPAGIAWPDDVGAQWRDGDDVADPESDGRMVTVLVEVGRGSPVDEDDLDRYVAATAAIDSDDPDVVRFARRVDRPGRSDEARAAALRTAVHRHITRKGLATAFATAGETVRSRAGDCTEHAVLLAAALRAVGIPSRTVSGLVWTRRDGEPGGAFLWHMWTQAAIGGVWRDFDATLASGLGFHPGHLAVSVSDGSPRDIERAGRAMLEVFGSIGVEVLPVEVPAEGAAAP